MFKKLMQVLAIFACLPTQQSIAQSIPESATKRFERGFGIIIILPREWYMDIAGGPKHYAPNIGADFHVRYNFEYPKISIRGKTSYEYSGNRRLGEMYDHRSEVKCKKVLLGLVVRSPRGRPGYICVESGVAMWHIRSTFEPLVDFKANKNLTALLVGAETRAAYFEIGMQFFGFAKNKVVIPENSYALEINNIGYSSVCSAGIRF